jgi:hypothetical protein
MFEACYYFTGMDEMDGGQIRHILFSYNSGSWL